MQSALHQHTRPPEFYRLADLLVDGFEIQNVTLFGLRAFQGAVEGAESAVLGAEVGVIDVAVNDVGDHAFGVQLSPHRVRFHAMPIRSSERNSSMACALVSDITCNCIVAAVGS